MGLKCSVLGHKYGDATVERDREEQGSEVVITIREIETCERCGEERVVSENKEVTTLATPDEPMDDGDEADDDGAAEPADGAADGSTVGAGDSDAAGSADDAGDAGTPDDGDEADDDGAAEPVDDAPRVDATEGAEILEAEADADESAVDDELADPSIEDAGLGSDPVEEADDGEEDAVIIDEGDGEAEEEDELADDVRAPGEWPEEPDDGDDDASDWTPGADGDEDGPITAPDAGTENNKAVTIPDGQFRCPTCGYTTLVESSSLRAGDFCPECRKGSLVHEPRDETRKE